MCDPATITIATTLMSAGLGAAGQIQQGKAAKAASNQQANVADMNAKISSARARDAIDRGQQEEQEKRREVAQFQGRQQAAMAANGVDIGYGSALDTLVDTATFGELDALTVRSNAAREAYGHDVDSANKTADAQLSRMEGKGAKKAGYLAAGSTLLSAAGDAYGSYKKRQIGSYA
jgi:hypothetical protein